MQYRRTHPDLLRSNEKVRGVNTYVKRKYSDSSCSVHCYCLPILFIALSVLFRALCTIAKRVEWLTGSSEATWEVFRTFWDALQRKMALNVSMWKFKLRSDATLSDSIQRDLLTFFCKSNDIFITSAFRVAFVLVVKRKGRPWRRDWLINCGNICCHVR